MRLAIPDGILLCKRELKISRGCTSVFAKHSERRFMRVFSPCKSGQPDWQLLGDSTSFAKRSRVGGWVGHSILYTLLGCSLYHPEDWSWADRQWSRRKEFGQKASPLHLTLDDATYCLSLHYIWYNITLRHIRYNISLHNIWHLTLNQIIHYNRNPLHLTPIQKMLPPPIVCLRKYKKVPKPKQCISRSRLRWVEVPEGSRTLGGAAVVWYHPAANPTLVTLFAWENHIGGCHWYLHKPTIWEKDKFLFGTLYKANAFLI